MPLQAHTHTRLALQVQVYGHGWWLTLRGGIVIAPTSTHTQTHLALPVQVRGHGWRLALRGGILIVHGVLLLCTALLCWAAWDVGAGHKATAIQLRREKA